MNDMSLSDNHNGDNAHYNPLVSVITPVLNGVKYLETCVESVLAQGYPFIEQIFVDGGSTDGTVEILLNYQAKYPKNVVFVSDPGKMVGDALNKGISVAKGDIICWLDSDDVYELNAIQIAIDFFRANPDAYFLFGGCNMINERGEIISQFTIKDFDLREAVTRWHYIVFCAVFFKREVIQQIGSFNSLGNDLDFYIRVNRVFQMHQTKYVLANWRSHKDGISKNASRRAKIIRRNRMYEDVILCLKNGGNILSPKCVRYYLHICSPVSNFFRPFMGMCYPLIKRVLGIEQLYP